MFKIFKKNKTALIKFLFVKKTIIFFIFLVGGIFVFDTSLANADNYNIISGLTAEQNTEVLNAIKTNDKTAINELLNNGIITKTGWMEDAFMWFDKWEKEGWAATAWKAALGDFLNRLAYDTATYLATGDKGQAPMFKTDSLGDFVKNAADYAVGDALEALGDSGTLGMRFNVCSPNPDVQMMIGLGIQREYRPRDPDCTFNEMKNNWDEELTRPDFLNRFSNMFDPRQNNLGIALTVRSGIEEEATKVANQALQNYIMTQGWEPVKSLISDKISTPASLVKEKGEIALNKSTMKEEVFTGNIIADAISTFANTLIGKLASQWFGRGLVSRFPDNSYQGDWGGFEDYEGTAYSGGISGAKDRFNNLIKPNFKVRGDYEILGELMTCPNPTKAGPTNCVITNTFGQAVSGNMTVSEAIEKGFLPPNGIFGFTSEGLEPSYMEGYPYRSMIILRKFRILPVGWELAAQYIKDNGNAISGTKNLQDLIDCFSFDDEYEGYEANWCAGMVDPSWVLKAPLNYCKKEGPGPEILSKQVVGTGDDSSVMLSRNTKYCADEQSCIKETQDGSCELYGYCTEERRKWDFNAESCEPIFNTCQTFRNRDGKTVSYLENGLDYGDCSIDNVGCLDFCEDFDNDINNFTCTNSTGDKVYFDKDAKECTDSAEGCHEFIRTKPGLGSNLIYDSSFENNILGDVTANWEVVGDAYDGRIALKLSNDFSRSLTIGPDNYQLAGETFALSVFAKDCTDGDSLQFETASTSITASTDWKRYIISYTFPESSFGNTADIAVNTSGACTIDAIKLERGSATAYSDYRDDGLVYQRLAPDYLGCNTNDPASECDDYTRTCSNEEVGCELYTGTKDKMSIPAKVITQDYCAEECVDYNSYFQSETSFDSLKPTYLIPRIAKKCSAVAVGCDEFTNLDKIGEDAEKREYYAYLRQCVKPTEAIANCNEFYTWEGSSETGYQLRVHVLQTAADGGPATTEDDGMECSKDIYNLPASDPGHNSDCREFYNTDGELFYNLYSKTLSCSDNCHPYRRTEDNIISHDICQSECGSDVACQTDCVSTDCSDSASDGAQSCNYDASANATDSIFCKNNGKWNSQHGACLYSAVPGEGKTCSASSVGCREYTGSAGNNMRIVLNSDFEGSLKNWEGLDGTSVDINQESLIVGGESLEVAGGSHTAAVNVTGLVQKGKAYYLSFLAKTNAVTTFEVLGIGVTVATAENFILDISSPANLSGEWQIFKFNLSNLNHEISSEEKLIISADGDFFIDDVRLTEITDRYYLIKNSWNIPESCYYDINGNYVGDEVNLGCAEYFDRENNYHYLHSFDQLCADSAVGCELMIDTHNYSSNDSGIWNDIDSDGACTAADGADCIAVDGDNYDYVVFDNNKRCNSSEKGCQLFGLPYSYSNSVSYDQIYLKNNPDEYNSILCNEDVVDCEEWSSGNSMSYFKDPGDQVCEWRQTFGGENSSWEWFKKKVKKCDLDSNGTVLEDDPYCRDNSDCPINLACTSDIQCGANNFCVNGNCFNSCILDNEDRACYTDTSAGEIKTIGLGGAGNAIVQPAMDDLGTPETDDDLFWVGLCPAGQSGCSEYIDPISRFSSNLLYDADFSQNVDGNAVADGWSAAVNGVQNINLKPNTLYILAIEGNNAVNLQAGVSSIFNILNPLSNSFVSFVNNVNIVGVAGERISRSFYTENTAGNVRTTITVTNASVLNGSKIELKEAIVDYQLKQNLDRETCNGILDFEEGCVLFNERVRNNNGLASLIYDADATINDGSGISPTSGIPQYLDSNSLLKVTPDRDCDKWLACRSYIKDENNNNVCYDVGLCDNVDKNNNCNNFVVTEKVNQTRTNTDFYDMSGYNKIGYSSSGSFDADLYSFGNMDQDGEVSVVSNGDFEFYGDNRYPIGWVPQNGSAWNENLFTVINNPVRAQSEAIDYPMQGSSFLKFSSEHTITAPYSEFIDLEPNTDYTVSFFINTLNFKSKNDIKVAFRLSMDTFNSAGTQTGTKQIVQQVPTGEDWKMYSGKFTTDNVIVRARIQLVGYAPGLGDCRKNVADRDNCVGNIYIDDISIKPVLVDASDKTVNQTCRLYPKSDSLACSYYEDSGNKQKGWLGYCMEYDRYPGNDNNCLLWYPVDKVKGEDYDDGLGYRGKAPVYYSVSSGSEAAEKSYGQADGEINFYAGANPPDFETLEDLGIESEDIKEVTVDNLSSINVETYAIGYPGSEPPGSLCYVAIDTGGFSLRAINDFTIINDSGTGCCKYDPIERTCDCSSCTMGGVCGSDYCDSVCIVAKFDSNGSFTGIQHSAYNQVCLHPSRGIESIAFNYNKYYASTIVQTVTPIGQNKFWSGRVYEGSDFVTPCNAGLTYLDQECTYISDYKPFGSLVPPGDTWNILANPYEWDSKSGIAGYQPLYFETPNNQARAGQLHPIGEIKRLFAKSYGTWEWNGSRYVKVEGIEWIPPIRDCNGNGMPPRPAVGDYCGILPRVDNDYNNVNGNTIKVNDNTGNIFLSNTGFMNLTFNTVIDSQQQPLAMLSADWGDNEKTVISGVEIREQTDLNNPHSLYHLYSYWDMKAKRSVDQADTNSIYCGTAGAPAVNYDGNPSGMNCPLGSNCCIVQPSVKIKDNWGWCNNGINNTPCPAGTNAFFDGWIFVLEK